MGAVRKEVDAAPGARRPISLCSAKDNARQVALGGSARSVAAERPDGGVLSKKNEAHVFF